MNRKTTPMVFMLCCCCWWWFSIEPLFADPGRDLCKIYDGGLKCHKMSSHYFPEDTFQTFNDDLARFTNEMKFLQIENSNISVLQSRSFQRSPHVAQLVLRNIHLVIVEPGAFEGLRRIKLVDLSFNLIRDISPDTFKYTTVNSLKLEGNVNLKIPDETPVLQSSTLTSLSFRNCNIQHLYDLTFQELPALLQLDLGQNRLTSLPDKIFSFAPQLSFLDLSSNLFTTMSIEVFKAIPSFPKYPTGVILSNNPWVCDCKISALVDWASGFENGDGRKTSIIKKRLKKLVKCEEPKKVFWNDLEFKELMRFC